MNIRYVITAIKKDGTRQLAFNNNHLNTFDTAAEAQEMLNHVITNNNAQTVADHVGKDLKVYPVDCWEGGDAKRTVFPDNEAEYLGQFIAEQL